MDEVRLLILLVSLQHKFLPQHLFTKCKTLQLAVSAQVLPPQVRGHVRVSRQRALICLAAASLFCRLSVVPLVSVAPFALTELTGGLTVEFYHHPFFLPPAFSSLPPPPCLSVCVSLSLSLSLFLLSPCLYWQPNQLISALFYLIDEMLGLKRFFGRRLALFACAMCATV